MKKAIFLDRDGIINVDNGYIFKIKDFKFISGIIDELKKIQKLGYIFFIITNQSGIARGYFSEEDFFKLNNYMLKEFSKNEIIIEKVSFCPHYSKGLIKKYSIDCRCRKPNIGMFEDILSKYNIDIKNSYMVGDKESDILAGSKVGLNTILISNNKIKTIANYNFSNFNQIFKVINK